MTLATRFALFSLGTLAAVLIGFSATLYLLARTYLHRQVEDRLEAALHILSATVEVKSDGVEWESAERPVTLEPPPGEEPIAWQVCDDRGRPIDGSRGHVPNEVFAGAAGWRVKSRRVPDATSGSRDTSVIRKKDKDKKYPYLVLRTALPLTPVAATLRHLLLLLIGLSSLLWLSAALVGGRLCRRALAPVRHMAEAARAMNAAEPSQRLPAVTTGDELEELNHAFNQLLGRLQESFERQRRFTGDASHQLRTPLTSLLGHIDLALRRPRAAEDYPPVLGVLRQQTLQMRQIVETLLFLARADAEANAPSLEPLDLRAWLTEHLAAWSGHARAGDVRLELAGEGPLWVQAQAPLLGQLLDNLLENAGKYSAAGTPITVSATAEKDGVCLSVADEGCGITTEDLQYIFDPFYRSKQARTQGVAGTGLGLAVAQRIAVALGGVLQAHSQPGQGARFTLRLSAPASGVA